MAATPFAAPSPAFSPPPHQQFPNSPAAAHSLSQANTPRQTNNLAVPRRIPTNPNVANTVAGSIAPSGRSVSGAGGQSGVALEDARVELSRALALLTGVEGAQSGGEVGRLLELLGSSRTAYENAFEDGAAPPPAPRDILASLTNLQNLLKSSPLGAAPISASGEAAPEDVSAAVARTSASVQTQFRQRQRAKEGAEIVAGVLSAA